MPKAMIITVGTGRDRKDIASAICNSIRQQNPTEIIFVVTKLSNAETMPFIQSDENVKDKKFSYTVLSDENDLERIKIECNNVIKNASRNYQVNEITVDYTSGTKAMSAGIILSAIENKIGAISYITGKRDKEGRVVSGSERIISFTPNETYAYELFSEAIKSFNNYHYDLAFQLLDEAKKLFPEAKFVEKTNIVSQLSNAYSQWDKFNISNALDLLKQLPDSSFYAEWGIKNSIEKNKQILYKETIEKFCEERMVDLFLNAQRRQKEHKYDDAVARLYRLLEYIAQFLIANKKLYQVKNNGEFDTSKIDLNKIPPEFAEKYREKIGLDKSYELLNDLKNLLGIEIYSELKSTDGVLKKLLAIRNNSILAHGFDPVKENSLVELSSIMEKFLRKIIRNFDTLIEHIEFPKIKL